MIVFAGGLQKSGTVWLFNLVRDMTIKAGWHDVYKVRKVHQELDNYFAKHFATLRGLDDNDLSVMNSVHEDGFSIVVHTHCSPTQAIDKRRDDDWWKVIFIYRDPRAIAISAYDHGKKNRAKGIIRPFGWITTVGLGILYARYLLLKYEAWKKFSLANPERVMLCKYEELLSDPESGLTEICVFLNIFLDRKKIIEIIETYSKDEAENNPDLQSRLHFNVGDPNRYLEEFNNRQRLFSKIILGRFIKRMGYIT